MPLEINTTADPGAGGAPRALLKSIETYRGQLRRVDLEKAGGRAGYRATSWYVNVLTPDEAKAREGDDDSPEGIAKAVWDMACKHADQTGAGNYRAVLYGEKRDGTIDELDKQSFAVDVDGGNMSAPERKPRDAAVDLVDVSIGAVKDFHKINVEAMRSSANLLKEIAPLANPMAQVQLEIEKMRLERQEREEQREYEMYKHNRTMAFLENLSGPAAAELPNLMRHMVGVWTSSKVPDSAPPAGATYADRLNAILQGVPQAKIDELQGIWGEDMWSVLLAMRAADEDRAFCDQARKLDQLLGTMSDAAKITLTQKMVIALGPTKCAQLQRLIVNAAQDQQP